MYFTLTGINHHTAPIEVREKTAISSDRLHKALLDLRKHTQHAIILSTCNRTEIYASGTNAEDIAASCSGYMRETLNMADDILAPYIYKTSGKELFRHLFSVACGLDSMVIGEYEVLGQVRQALAAAEKRGRSICRCATCFRALSGPAGAPARKPESARMPSLSVLSP